MKTKKGWIIITQHGTIPEIIPGEMKIYINKSAAESDRDWHFPEGIIRKVSVTLTLYTK